MKTHEKILAEEIIKNKDYLEKEKLFNNVKNNWVRRKEKEKRKKTNNIIIIIYILFISLIIALI